MQNNCKVLCSYFALRVEMLFSGFLEVVGNIQDIVIMRRSDGWSDGKSVRLRRDMRRAYFFALNLQFPPQSGTYGDIHPDGAASWIAWAEDGQARMRTHSWANLRRYLDNSPYYQADKIRTQLLIVHGDQDIAYHDAEKLFSALRRLDRTVQLVTYHGQRHVLTSWALPNAIDAAKRMIEFYQRYLGMPASISPGG